MKAPPFNYTRADHLAEVFELLIQHGADAKILAGGQSLMPALNMRLSSPALLIDISRLGDHAPQLTAIRLQGACLHIGALATHAEVGASPVIRKHFPLLADAATHIAHPAIRNRGTFGGSLATADPAAEWPACCVALDAQIVLTSKSGSRQIAAREFFQGIYTTALQPDEIITEVIFPVPGEGWRQAFVELARRRGDYAIAGVAALAKVDGSAINDLHLAFLGVGDKPVLAVETSRVFVSKGFSDSSLRDAQQALAIEIDPAADLYTSAAAKRHLAQVLAGRVMKQLLAA
jgi:carbon-monoxide dehydrogenase medium subunit